MYECEDFKRVKDPKSGRCGRRARWYVVSGPMFVCWNHKRHQEAQGHECAPLEHGGGW